MFKHTESVEQCSLGGDDEGAVGLVVAGEAVPLGGLAVGVAESVPIGVPVGEPVGALIDEAAGVTVGVIVGVTVGVTVGVATSEHAEGTQICNRQLRLHCSR